MKNKILKISVLVIMKIVSVFALSGCTETVGKNKSRFIQVSDEGTFNIYYDSKSKIMYAVDAEGKPLLYNE